MYNGSKKILSSLLAAALTLSLFTVLPLTAAATTENPINVTENPVGAIYVLNQTSVPIKATFYYNGSGDLLPDWTVPIKVQWYWSLSGSDKSRGNGLGESVYEDWYSRPFTHQTTLNPATDAAGVLYYYAVLEYKVFNFGANDDAETRYAVTESARIEVIAPEAEPEQSFVVKKVDENGDPLADAVFALTPNTEHSWGEMKSYEAVSGANGYAEFTVKEGSYILSEKKAPEGYSADDKTYVIQVQGDQISEVINYNAQQYAPYEMIVFINKKIPAAPPAPTSTPILIATPTPAASPSPGISPIPEITPSPAAPGGKQLDFSVKKTDENGNPLAGATMRVSGLNDSGVPRVYDTATDSKGDASFTVEEGSYVISEYAAPPGYNATDETYRVVVTANGIFAQNNLGESAPYSTVTFVNKVIPTLNKEDHFAFMQGYPDGTFGQEQNMTRAEAVVMFSRLLMKSMNTSSSHTNGYYPDVASSAWYANEVGYMQALGVLADYSRDGNFRPDDQVTRAEFATLATHFDNLALSETNKFSDVSEKHWAVKYINSAEAKGWITGYPDGMFKPENNITRAEVVTLVGRMLDRHADSAYLAANAGALPRNYADLNSSHWAYIAIMEASISHDYTKDSAGEHWTKVY